MHNKSLSEYPEEDEYHNGSLTPGHIDFRLVRCRISVINIKSHLLISTNFLPFFIFYAHETL